METGGKTAAKRRAGKSRTKNQALPAQLAPIAAAILLAGFLAGCSGLASGVKTTIQAAFQLNPASVSFGKVNVGKQTTQTIAVTNTGNTSVSITQVSFSNPRHRTIRECDRGRHPNVGRRVERHHDGSRQ